MRHFLRRCALCAFTAVLTVLAVTGLVEPANSRADDDCAPGWVWSPDLNQRLSTCAGVTSLPPAHRLTGNNGHSPFQW